MVKATVLTLVAAASVTLGAQGQDFSKVEIKATRLANNFYTLEGQGGVIGVLTGADGVFMVDSQFAPLTDKIVAAIKQISDGRIRYMVNTHQHPDHTGGNENLAKMGVTVIARDELRAGLVRAGGANPPSAGTLPLVTYKGSMTFHMNGEDVQLIPIPAAHTDGDTMVYFPAADVIMTGDYYRSIQFPNIDRANGGSLKGMLAAFDTTIAAAKPTTRIVPGHGPMVDRAAVAAHRDMVIAIRDKVAALIKQGKTLAEVQAAKPTADFDAKVQQPGTTGERFVGQLYAELGGK